MADMAMFTNAKDVQISGGEFTLIHGKKTPMEVLYEKSAPGASHDSQERFDAPKCHPDTRVAVTDDILLQIKIAVVSTIIWLYGAAGAGKSSIAQTLAEMCSEEKLLIGDFFFFRTAPFRNNAQRLAASLAYNLAQTIPSTLQYIAVCIQKNPGIFDRSLEKQLQQLFVEPLRQACENDPRLCPRPRLLLLDGLDECDTPEVQQHILKVLGKVLQTTPIPIVVLVASRPEPHISSIMDSPEDLSQITTSPFGLNDMYDADADIRLFTKAKLNHTKRSHPLKKYIPEDWPTSEDVESIVQKSSGQFIFAATIARFVESPHHKPQDQLRIALDASKNFSSKVGNSPFAALDALYMQILSGVKDKVMVLAILHHVLSIEPIDSTVDANAITRRFNLAPGDVEVHLSNLASLVKFEGKGTIRVYHASLRDFLLDKTRSKDFYIQQEMVILFLSKIYLNHVLKGDLEYNIPVATAFLKLSQHPDDNLSNILSRLEKEFPTFLYKHLVDWRRRGSGIGFWRFISEVEELCNAVSTTFWNQCLGRIHEFLKYDLSDFLNPPFAIEFLAYMAFKELHGGLGSDDFRYFVRDCFHAGGSVRGSISLEKYEQGAGSGRRDQPRNQILRNFLLDESLSGKLAITPSHFLQSALKCAKYLESKIMRFNYSGMEPQDGDYAIVGLASILEYAPRDDRLIQSLEKSEPLLQDLARLSSDDVFASLPKAVASYLDVSEADLKDYLLSEKHSGVRSIWEQSLSARGDLQAPLTSGPHPIQDPPVLSRRMRLRRFLRKFISSQ